MTKKLLKQKIAKGLNQNISLLDYRSILVKFKESNGNQEDALKILQELRQITENETIENTLLEIMDLASGWCRKDLRVW
jgi:hypothetical protein